LLQAADVTFAYGDQPIVCSVSLDVADDGFVGIIGPNGSGKTTLLRLLAGTRTPQRGRVLLDGVPLQSLSRGAVARRMAVVPQETQLAFEYTVLEIVLMGRYPHLGAFALEGPSDIALARGALEVTGTRELEERMFSTLSGGEKQRVIIAAALAQITVGGFRLKPEATASSQSNPGSFQSNPGNFQSNPGSFRLQAEAPQRVLLLDEPTAALDLKYQLEVASLLKALHADHTLAVVISTHDLNFAAGLCRTLVMLKEGRVLAAGPVAEVLTPPRIRELYDVDADVAPDPRSGRLRVTPLELQDRS
jgi:iron complex transport system ATP-binding protein